MVRANKLGACMDGVTKTRVTNEQGHPCMVWEVEFDAKTLQVEIVGPAAPLDFVIAVLEMMQRALIRTQAKAEREGALEIPRGFTLPRVPPNAGGSKH